jgi:hypothetical protein
MSRRIVWRACACYVWPILPLYPASRCGWCREYAERPVSAPAEGRARPL